MRLVIGLIFFGYGVAWTAVAPLSKEDPWWFAISAGAVLAVGAALTARGVEDAVAGRPKP